MEGSVVDVEGDVDVLLLYVVVAALHNQYTIIITNCYHTARREKERQEGRNMERQKESE